MTQQEQAAAERLLAVWGKRLTQYGGKSLTESQRDESLAYDLALTAFRDYKAESVTESHEGPLVRITETAPLDRAELQAINRHLKVWRSRLDQAPVRSKASDLENADITLYSLTFNAYLKACESCRQTESVALAEAGFKYIPGKGYLFKD